MESEIQPIPIVTEEHAARLLGLTVENFKATMAGHMECFTSNRKDGRYYKLADILIFQTALFWQKDQDALGDSQGSGRPHVGSQSRKARPA